VNPAGLPEPSGAVMVCGTTSNAGKTTLVAGLCRHYARLGARVAPFKAQNMANNSAVTPSGHEIGRAQAWQAAAAGTSPEVAMNPVLLKPTAPGRSQVVVMGRPVGVLSAAEYHRRKPELLGVVLDALAHLRRTYDVVILEGAGSPAEINLLDHDIVNLRVAHEAGLRAVIVGDIDLGGVFAALYGTVALLPDHYRASVGGFVLNKFRGDPALLAGAGAQLEARCGVPTLGVLPWLDGAALDGEDAMVLERPAAEGPADERPTPGAPAGGSEADLLDVAVVRLPHVANFTDFDPLLIEPGVGVRWVDDERNVGRPDLLVLPGSKATVADLAWLRRRGLERAIASCPTTVLGICAGYQMLGAVIEDPVGIESEVASTPGLGLLDAVTRFDARKVTRLRAGRALDRTVHGYQLHHGVVRAAGPAVVAFSDSDGGEDGARGRTPGGGTVLGTTLHGLLDDDDFRAVFLGAVAARAGKRYGGRGRFELARQQRIDTVADAIEEHLDLGAVDRLLAAGRLVGREVRA
jgi:adenosylcobyric acid synthase